jgi:two-component system NarL family sensor kinase
MQRIAKAAVSLLEGPARTMARGAPEGPTEASFLAESFKHLIDDLPEQIALIETSGAILVANQAWTKTVEDHGYLDALPGRNYRTFCAAKAAEGYEPARQAGEALDELVAGKRSSWRLVYNGRERWNGRDFEISFRRLAMGSQTLIVVVRFDLTEIIELRRARHDLTESLIEGRAVERRRMARELHDSTAQVLTAVKLLLGHLRHETAPGHSADLVDELQDLVTEAQQEIRSVAFLTSPPALEQGLAEALKALVEGFGRRAGLETRFDVSGIVESVRAPVDIAFFRIAQEALSNVYRHAHARRVRLSLHSRASATHLMIIDDGIGISRASLKGTNALGVGLGIMRARMNEIGGRLTARRLSQGTAIIATVPNRSVTAKADLTIRPDIETAVLQPNV